MKIQSVKKLRKQAEHYSKTHKVVMPPEWEFEYLSTIEQFLEVEKASLLIQEQCPARWGNFEKCNCSKHPDYIKAQSILKPIVRRLENMNCERAGLQRLVYEKELGSLLRMRSAKIDYCKTL